MGIYRLQKQENVTCSKQSDISGSGDSTRTEIKRSSVTPRSLFSQKWKFVIQASRIKRKKQKQKVTFGWKGTGHRDRKGVKNSKLGHAVKHDEVDDDGIGWAKWLAAHGIPVHLTLSPTGHWTARCHALSL